MSTSVLNGTPRRKQLSDQLDRFDGIIDALAGGLPEAVAAATRDGAKEAIAQVLRELFTDPTVLAALRGCAPPVVSPSEVKPSAWTRLKAAVRAAATRVRAVGKTTVDRVVDYMKPVVSVVTKRLRKVRAAVMATRHLFDLAWRVKRAVLVGLAVGVLVLFACQLSHTAASVLAGVGAGLTAAVAHFGLWVRRTARRLASETN